MKKREKLILARGNRTQDEIANLCGVKQQTYSNREMGRATPAIKKILLIEKVLGVPKEQLFDDIFNSFNDAELEDQNRILYGLNRILGE